MRLRAEHRRQAEWALRTILFAALIVALWRSVRSSSTRGTTVAVAAATLGQDLARVISSGAAQAVDLNANAVPTRAQRELLLALEHSGTPVTWHGELPAVALEVTREHEPFADGHITTVSDGKTPLVLADSAGPLDTVRSSAATMQLGTLVGTVRAAQGLFAARAAVPTPTDRRAILVLGRVGWEVKFVSAALTESGWTVRSSSPVAPTVTVHDDAILPLDTARYDAVIALDSTADAFGTAIDRFVAQGGGLVALGTALELSTIRDIAPALAGERRPGKILLSEDTVTTRDLPARALVNVRADAVTLLREPQGVVLAAHRAGLGRVLAVGYDETWRWRMLGGESGLSQHRDWWSHAVGAVAPARTANDRAQDGDAAPRASLVDALGPPSAAATTSTSPTSNPLPLFVLALLTLVLVVETASRRFRGAR